LVVTGGLPSRTGMRLAGWSAAIPAKCRTCRVKSVIEDYFLRWFFARHVCKYADGLDTRPLSYRNSGFGNPIGKSK